MPDRCRHRSQCFALRGAGLLCASAGRSTGSWARGRRRSARAAGRSARRDGLDPMVHRGAGARRAPQPGSVLVGPPPLERHAAETGQTKSGVRVAACERRSGSRETSEAGPVHSIAALAEFSRIQLRLCSPLFVLQAPATAQPVATSAAAPFRFAGAAAGSAAFGERSVNSRYGQPRQQAANSVSVSPAAHRK